VRKDSIFLLFLANDKITCKVIQCSTTRIYPIITLHIKKKFKTSVLLSKIKVQGAGKVK